MDFENIIRNRFSVRKFSNKKLEEEKLNKILEAGRLAPTAKNLQPFKICVISSNDGIKKLDECTPCRYGSSTVLLMLGDKENAFKKDDDSTYVMDSSIACTHMMLEATNLGVDSIWIEFFDKEKIKEEFNISENLEPVCLLDLGYKAEDCPVNPMHNKRKSLEDLVIYK